MVDTNGGALAPPFQFRDAASQLPSRVKRLVVNADDFGYAKGVNDGIVTCHLDGLVRSTSLMANGVAVEHAARLAHKHPSLGVGCHLVLVEGESVSRPGVMLPATLGGLIAATPSIAEIRSEFRAQVERLLGLGLHLTHLDTHKHLHLLPAVLEVVANVADEFGIGWVRRPFDATRPTRGGYRAAVAMAMQPLRIAFDGQFRRARWRTTDYFCGFEVTGRMDASWLIQTLPALPGGIGELVCHPGYCDAQLQAMPTRLKRSRERELAALCDQGAARAAERAGIELVSYRDLGRRSEPT